MKKLEIKIILFTTILTCIVSCSKGGGPDDSIITPDPEPDPITINLPNKPVTTFPVNGEVCSDFDSVANDNSKARIKFEWENATYANTYVLKVTESGNVVADVEIAATAYYVTLNKGKTFSWTITAKNDDGINTSQTNSFTTPGKPIGNYIPYTAVISFNINNTTNMASLSWVGSDQDSEPEDLVYNVLIKENDIEILSIDETTETSIDNFNVLLNSTYEIKINTIDKYGSYSSSKLIYIYE